MEPDLIEEGEFLEGDALRKEYRLRLRGDLQRKIGKEDAVPEGWTVAREFKKTYRLTREKRICEQLEDRVWELLYLVGARAMTTRDFALRVKSRPGATKTRRIGVVAVVDDVAFVVECRSRESRGTRGLSSEITTFAEAQSPLRNAVKACLDDRGLQVIFVLATADIDPTAADREDARRKGIHVWDEYEQLALLDLAKVAGRGAKYQLLNRVLYGTKVKGFDVRVPALEAKMGGHTYYTFVMNPEHLLKIAYVHQRPVTCTWLDLSASYQRVISSRRVRKVERFIRDGGFFPGSIILNFTRDIPKPEKLGRDKHLADARKDARPVIIKLPPYYGCAWVVDGQHRLYGYANTDHRLSETVPVVAFVNELATTQAKMFVDINENQKTVGPDLLWDLYEDLYAKSDDEREQELRAISRIAKELNRSPDSPFKDRVVIPSAEERPPGANVSLRAVCTSIKREHLVAQGRTELLYHEDWEQTVGYAYERIAAYFGVIRDMMPDEWEMGEDHYVRTSAAFVVLSGVLRDLLSNLDPKERRDLGRFKEQVNRYLWPLMCHLHEADPSALRDYRGAGGASQASRRYRAKFTRIIQADSKLQFRSKWLEGYDAATAKAEKTRRQRLGIRYYIDREESEVLEFKASLALDVDRLLKGDHEREESDDVKEAALKTIVALLNTRGGHLIVGLLECSRYRDVEDARLSEFPKYGHNRVFGLEGEYREHGWDGFERRLCSLIRDRIGGRVLDAQDVTLAKHTLEGKDLCDVTVEASASRQYLDGGRFFVRRGTQTNELTGRDADEFWATRKRS